MIKFSSHLREPIEAEAKPSRKGFWCSNADVISVVPKSDDDYNQFLLSTKIQSLKPQDITEATAQERRPYDERDHDHIGIEMANLSKISADPKIVMLIYGSAAMRMEAVADDPEAFMRNSHFPSCVMRSLTVKFLKLSMSRQPNGAATFIPMEVLQIFQSEPPVRIWSICPSRLTTKFCSPVRQLSIALFHGSRCFQEWSS